MTTTTLSASAVRTQMVGGGGTLEEVTNGALQAGDNWLGSSWSCMEFNLPAGLAGGTINEAKVRLYISYYSQSGDMGRTVFGVAANNTPLASQNVPGATLGTNVRYIADDNYAGYGYSDYDYTATNVSTPLTEIDVTAMMNEAKAAGRYAGGVAQFIWRLQNRVYGTGYGEYYQFGTTLSLYLDYTPANLSISGPSFVNVGETKTLTVSRPGTSGDLVVNLSQSPGGLLTIPSTATIANGSTSQTFDITGASVGSTTLTGNDGTNTADFAVDSLTSGLGSEVVWLCPSMDSAGAGTLTATDFSGNGYSASLTNMDSATDWPADTSGGGVRALDFDGTNDLLTISDSDGLSFTNGSGQDLPFSISAWVYFRSAGGGSFPFASILSKYASYSPFLGEYLFGINSSRQLEVMILSGSTSARLWKVTTATVTQNQWVHVGMTYSGNETHAGIKVYINGAEVSGSSSGSGHTGMSNRSGPVSIGAALYDGETTYRGYLNGRLDDIRLFDAELSGAEMATLAATTRSAGPSAAVLYHYRTRMAHV